MARGINKVILVGTLGRDPEMKYAANGNAIANINIATSEQWNDKSSGQKQEKTEWHRVVIFGKLAEIAGQYLTKGSLVYIEGKLQTSKWQDTNSGQDRYSTDVVVSGFDGSMQMLGGGANRNSGGDAAFGGGAAPAGNQGFQQPMMGQGQGNNQNNQMNNNQFNQQTNQQSMQSQANPAAFGQQSQSGFNNAPKPAPKTANKPSPLQQAPSYEANDFDDDDVPF